MVVGAQVGAYRLIEQIGEGGMGSVWLAEHTMLGRRAAVKLLHSSFSDRPDIVTRFFNEARAATQISDPGIVQIFDFGHTGEGQAFIAMELLDGEPLDQRLHRLGRLQVQQAVRIVRQVASSLGAAHARNIVHRDLKPENIYLVRDPEVPGGERAKILDFGIAKLLGDQPGAAKTQTNAVMGTPIYMSPEQCRGSGGVDARSDVYSLGCVLFTLIAGVPPFNADGQGELLVAHITQPPPRVTSIASHVPSNVDALIARCLEKDPAARYQNGAELASALGTLLSSVSDSGLSPRVLPADAATAILPGITTLGGAASQATASTTAPRSGRRGLVAALATLVIAGGAIAFVTLRDREGEHADVPPAETEITNVAPPPGATPTPPQAAEAPAPPSPTTDSVAQPMGAAAPASVSPEPAPAPEPAPTPITITIQTTPPGAHVFVDRDAKPRGTTPYELVLERAAEPVEIRLVRRGFVTLTQKLDRTDSSKLVLVLEKEKKRVARTTPALPPGDSAATPATTTGTDDSDDTMNPFAKKKE
jgi:serine/threonine-protein kinase